MTPAERAEVEALIRDRVQEVERDVRRSLASSLITQASRRVQVPRFMPCIVQSVGATVNGIFLNTYAGCLPDDAPGQPAILATRIGSPGVGDRGLLMFIPGGGVYVLGPIPL